MFKFILFVFQLKKCGICKVNLHIYIYHFRKKRNDTLTKWYLNCLDYSKIAREK